MLYTLLGRVFKRTGAPEVSDEIDHSVKTRLFSLFGPFFVLVVSNIEGFLEVIHSAGWFWKQEAPGLWQSRFWGWLNILELSDPPTPPFSFIPERAAGIWWWRASRVLQDFDMNGKWREIIDEFPFFSFLLGDLHPHVLAMPFAILGVGLALSLYFSRVEVSAPSSLLGSLVRWVKGLPLCLSDTYLARWIIRPEFWLAALVMGGLAFLNTWDFPIYVGLFVLASVLASVHDRGWSARRVVEFFELGIGIGLAGILLYLPFYLGFASQAGGLLPSLAFFTRGKYFWVMFASLLLPILVWLVWLIYERKSTFQLAAGIKVAVYGLVGLLLLSYLFGWFILSLPALAGFFPAETPVANRLAEWAGLFSGLHGGAPPAKLLLESLILRLDAIGTWMTLGALVVMIWGQLSSYRSKQSTASGDEQDNTTQSRPRSAHAFVLILVLTGSGLVIFPEFLYLRDQFGWRMNTIFKFYYQTWILWGMAAAYASAVCWVKLRKAGRIVFAAGWIILVGMALMYPIFGVLYKTNNLEPAVWTLDGTDHIRRYNSDEMDAIMWLSKAPLGVVAEAVGGSYTGYGRISTHSGQPTVLGWPGHESQWRGGAREMGSRQSDIDRLYKTSSWLEAEQVLKQYNIRYVYIGPLERTTFRVNENKFQRNLTPVFQNQNVTIYLYTPPQRKP